MSQVSNAVKLPQSVKAVVKTIKRKINQLPTVKVYQSRTKNNHTRQSSLWSWHKSIRREVI